MTKKWEKFELRADGKYYGPPIGPYDELDYDVLLEGIFSPDPEAEDPITSVTWEVSDGIEVDVPKCSFDDTSVKVWLKNADITKSPFEIRFIANTGAGRILSRYFMLEGIDR